jgi:MFS transporter, SP family, inositol transporter
VALLIGAIWAPQTRGKTLKQIEVERYGAPVDSTLADAAMNTPTTRTVA